MFTSRNAFDGDSCPVDEELLGRMYRASDSGLPKLVETVSSDVRVMLALFCYKRAHMHSLALAIASSCSERDLSRFAGRVGSALYAESRETAAVRPATSSGGRKPITLSTRPLSTIKPIDDTLDDELPEALTA